MDQILEIDQKKEALKQFKGKAFDILESEQSASWVAATDQSELSKTNGDSNRLYQLLIEGKQAHSIELVDTAVLDSAVARTDLFTPKQIKTLKKRCVEVEQRDAEVAALAGKEAEEKAAFERERIEMEKRKFDGARVCGSTPGIAEPTRAQWVTSNVHGTWAGRSL